MTYETMLALIEWSPIYHSEWDSDPEAYLRNGVMEEGRNCRLGKLCDGSCNFTAYLGIQHYDPLLWGYDGTPRSTFWVSLLIGKRTLTLQTYSTIEECRVLIWRFYAGLVRDMGI